MIPWFRQNAPRQNPFRWFCLGVFCLSNLIVYLQGESHSITMSLEELIAVRGYIVYSNVGVSMMPLLRQRRDIIEIKKKEPGRCHKYDVVLYKRGEKYILHRILRVNPDGYLIAGDHNTFVETDVTDDMILGIMTRVIRNGKSITLGNPFYRFYVHLWCDCYPLRMFLLRCTAKVGAILSKIYNIIVSNQ